MKIFILFQKEAHCSISIYPVGSIVKNLLVKVGDMDLIPHLGRFHVATEQLSPCTTAVEPVLWGPGATTTETMCDGSLCSTREACTLQPESRLHLAYSLITTL